MVTDMPALDIVERRGRGGDVIMRHNPQAMAKAHGLCVEFFSAAMRQR